jgi:hypothetical protein
MKIWSPLEARATTNLLFSNVIKRFMKQHGAMEVHLVNVQTPFYRARRAVHELPQSP